MNALRNSVRLIGHLGDVPKVKKLNGGKKLATIAIATKEMYRDSKGTIQTETTWHRLVAWGKIADIAEKYLKKGAEIAIEGKLTHRSYNDKKGEKQFITEIIVNSLLMLATKK